MIPRLAIAIVALSSCSGENRHAEQRERGRTSVIVTDSVSRASASPGAPADYDLQHQPPKKLEPTRNGVCRFEERDPSKRPNGLIPTNHSSNMIFWADRGAMLWDHANGFVDEGMVIKGPRIVAVREGMKDLWIFPAKEGDIYLYSGPEIFECRQPAAK
jgi:hypothetical protein